MAKLSFSGIGISALAAAVPKNTIINEEYQVDFFGKDAVREIVSKTGIASRRFATADMCASDLCFSAAERLFSDTGIERGDIDLLIFISQTPDYRMPATALLLHDRLGLNKSAGAFDLNLGCSGFVYGLSVAFSFLLQPHFKKILLLDGETRSRVYSPKDRKVAHLFGDGGVAALIERNELFGTSYFSLGSDGSKSDLIKIDAGGYRIPSSPETLMEMVVDDHGNTRTMEHGYMNGADVFNFVLQEIPKDVAELFQYSKMNLDEIDFFVFHQANSYMNNFLVRKLKVPPHKAPSCLDSFGNTSSVSIPLTIVSRLRECSKIRTKLFLSGFGVGMSWASCIMDSANIHISELVEI